MKKSVFLIDGVRCPPPDMGMTIKSEQTVDGGRNTLQQVVLQKVNRRIFKFDNVRWSRLTYAQFHWLRSKVEGMVLDLTFYDDYLGRIVTEKCYFGNLQYTASNYIDDGGSVQRPTFYRDVGVNIIDMGY